MIYQCERCGGSCVQEAGMYNLATGKYDAPAGKCDSCAGHGFLLPNNSIAELVELANRLERENAALRERLRLMLEAAGAATAAWKDGDRSQRFLRLFGALADLAACLDAGEAKGGG